MGSITRLGSNEPEYDILLKKRAENAVFVIVPLFDTCAIQRCDIKAVVSE